MEQLDCSVDGQAHTNGSLGEFSTERSGYAGKSGDYYYTYAMKFTVPEFAGIPKEITFGLYISSTYSSGHTLRAAVVSSLENFSLYVSSRAPGGEISDTNQVAAGQTPTFGNVTTIPKNYTFSLDGSKLSPGVYYLILWAGTAVGMIIRPTVDDYGNATATLSYESCAARIDGGEEILTAVCYIEIGGEQVQAIPCIDTGTGWLTGS